MPAGYGAFGKMPGLGDFFRINLPAGFVAAWDVWLQAGVLSARAALGTRWQSCYMSAPIWRFSFGQGLAGDLPMIGVVMPSVDRVGRQFPLTLAAGLDAGQSPLVAHFLAAASFAELESIALEALDEAMTRERLAERLAAAGLGERHLQRVAVVSDGALTLAAPGGADILPDLAADLAGRHFVRPSIWTAEAADGLRLMLCEGLPDAGRFQGLLDLDAPVWSPAAAA